MSMQSYASTQGRINVIKGEMIAHAVPFEVLAMGCKMKPMPTNKGDTIKYRRVLPYGATTANANSINRWSLTAAQHILQEGVTPRADQIRYQDVSVTLQEYGVLYSYTNKAGILHEDDIPEDQKVQTGQRIGLVREMIRYGSLKGCTNVYYGNGTSRSTVVAKISLQLLRHITKNLMLNHASMKTRVLAPVAEYDTHAIEAGFIVFCSTDCEPDIRDLPGFVPVAKYGGDRKPINENEIGACERFRFIGSPELTAYVDAGGAKGSTGMFSTSGSNLDVYPYIVMGEEAAYDVALRGGDSMDPTHIPAGRKEKTDPLGQRGYVGSSFFSAVLVANNGWMAVAECATTDTTPA